MQSAAKSKNKAQPLSLRHNFSWTFLGDGTFNFCQWAMLAVIAKLVSPAKVGEYSLALAITAPIILFANLSLRPVQATDVRRDYSFGEYFGLRLISLVFAVLAIIGVVAVIHPSVEVSWVIAMITLAKIFDSISDIMYGLQQQNERMDYISISRMIQGVLQLTIMALVFYVTRSLVWATVMVALGSGLVTLFYDVPKSARIASHALLTYPQPGLSADHQSPSAAGLLKPAWHKQALWTLTRLSLPLGFSSVLGMLNVNLPRYFVQDYAGASELGIFSAMWSMLHPVGMVAGAILAAVTPRLARYYVESIPQFKRMLFNLLGLAVLSGAVGVLVAHFFGRQVLTVLFRPAYASHPITFQWMMAAAGITYISSALNSATTAARSYKLQPYVYLVTMLSNLLACYLLVPRYGVLGAAWAYLIGCLVLALGFGILTVTALLSAKRRDREAPQPAEAIPAQR